MLGSMYLFLCLPVFSLVVVSVQSASLCSESLKKADNCAKEMFFWSSTEHPEVLTTLDDMDAFCKHQHENVKCLRSHEVCLGGFPREMLKLGATYMKDTIGRFCHSKEEQKIFLKHYRCFSNSFTRRKPVYECVDRFITMLKQIRDNFNYNDQFPGMCCTFDMFSSCVLSAAKKVCDDVTGPETAVYMQQVLLRSLTTFVDLSCGEYSTMAECEKSSPNISSVIEWTFISEVGHQDESVVFPILDIVSRHADNEDNSDT